MKISIITVCYNRAATIAHAMASVGAQRLEKAGGGSGSKEDDRISLEYVVVDGGSTDGTVELIREFEAKARRRQEEGGRTTDFSFRWISERDGGLYDALNKGIQMSTGDVVGVCNADDILAGDDTVAAIARAFAARDTDAVYSDVRFVRGGASVEELRCAPTVRYCTGRFFKNWMFRFATFPAHPSTFIRRACFDKYGLYSLDYSICADFELMLRFFYKNKIRARYLPICTHVMRTGGVSTKNVMANVTINREDLRALTAHGVWSCLPLIYLKYLFKIWGFVFRRR